MAPDRDDSPGDKFQRLVEIMARLRGPDGCPWDREQTFASIKPYLLEEAYEAIEAIDAGDWDELAEELGDLLLEVVFLAQMAAESGYFSVSDSLDAINEKLVRRHPHVFADGDARTAGEVTRRWDEIKAEEKRRKGLAEKGLLDGVPRSLPAAVEAQKLTAKASTVGFDWEEPAQVLAKLEEELEELARAREGGSKEQLEDEIGDLLFVLVNLARLLEVDAEQALRRTNRKFRQRFGYLEGKLRERGKTLEETGLDAMEALWQEAKQHP
jgi:MazG family protein